MVKNYLTRCLTLLPLLFFSGNAHSQNAPVLPRLVEWAPSPGEYQLLWSLLRDFTQAQEPFLLVESNTPGSTRVTLHPSDTGGFQVRVGGKVSVAVNMSPRGVPSTEDIEKLRQAASVLANDLVPLSLSMETLLPRLSIQQRDLLARIQGRRKWYETREFSLSLLVLQKYLRLASGNTLQSQLAKGTDAIVLRGMFSLPDRHGTWYAGGLFRSQNPARLPQRPELSNVSAVDLGGGGGRAWRVGEGFFVLDFYLETFLGGTFLANSHLIAGQPAFGRADTLSQPFWETGAGVRLNIDPGGPYRLRLGFGLGSSLPSLLLRSFEPNMILRDGQLLVLKFLDLGIGFSIQR